MNLQMVEARLKKFFDASYYMAMNPDVVAANLTAIEHYSKLGWNEGRRPNKWYTDDMVPAALLDKHAGVPVFVLFLMFLPNLNEEKFDQLCRLGAASEIGHDNCWHCDVIRNHFSSDYYRHKYEDISDSIDALQHYCDFGWREGRQPTPTFDPTFYLEVYSDIKEANINPFVHYITKGMGEGRKGAPFDNVKRKLLRGLKSYSIISEDYKKIRPLLAPEMPEKLFAKLINFGVSGKGICISISHDNYLKSTGGVQKFLSDESKLAQTEQYAYLHFSPTFPDIKLAPKNLNSLFLVNCTLNDEFVGTFTITELQTVLVGAVVKFKNILQILVIHSAMGWHMPAILAISELKFPKKFFYMHDYFSICQEYKLLRNNIEPCDGPPPESNDCNICVHGDKRVLHLQEFSEFFEKVQPVVIYPSNCARQVFEAARPGRQLSGAVVPHLLVKKKAKSVKILASDERERSLRIAFCGEPVAHKGFYHFEEIVNRCLTDRKLEFYHLGTTDTNLAGVQFVPVRLKEGKSIMAQTLSEHKIDVVFVGSTWRETFNFVAYEAVQAGAAVISLVSAGNVVDFITQYQCGVVVKNWNDCVSLLQSSDISNSVALWRSMAASLEFVPNRSVFSKGI